MVHEMPYDTIENKSLVKRIQEWITPRSIGKLGLGIMIGNKEFFFGFVVSSVVMETIVRKNKVKKYERPSGLRVVDL